MWQPNHVQLNHEIAESFYETRQNAWCVVNVDVVVVDPIPTVDNRQHYT